MHQKIKDLIKKEGIRVPFDVADFEYSNSDIDDWFRIRKAGKKYKYKRSSKKWEQDGDISVIPEGDA